MLSIRAHRSIAILRISSYPKFSMLNFLKAKWVFFGLEVPKISWVVAMGLVLFMLYYWCRMYFGVFIPIGKQLRLCRKRLIDLKQRARFNHLGLEAQTLNEIEQIFDQLAILRPWWQTFCRRLIRHSVDRSDYFWSAESPGETLRESALIGTRFNLSFCQSLPGIITGIGLLFTFIAILIALLDVRLANNRVEGIELLIQGLSGKFVSSIAALLLATIHLLLEKSALHRLRADCRQLAVLLDEMVPRVTLAHLFADVRAQVAEQTNALRSFNGSLAPVLKASITEGVGPTLERMAESIEGLYQLLRQNEAQKQQSITDSIEKLLKDLSESLAQTISGMSEAFSKNLAGSTETQFSELRTSLTNTAGLLGEMNNQFAGLTLKLEEMMAQMGQRLEANAEITAGAAKVIFNHAGDWMDRSSTQLEQMLNTHQQQAESVGALRVAFASTLADFNDAIGKHSLTIGGLREVAEQVKAAVGAISQSMRGAQSVQKALEQVAAQTRIQAENLTKANGHQEEIWRNLGSNLNKYSETFVQVEKAAQVLLNQIDHQLKNYTQTTQNGFKSLVEIADNHFSNATSRLGASVEELDEVLNDLTDTLGKTRQNGKG